MDFPMKCGILWVFHLDFTPFSPGIFQAPHRLLGRRDLRRLRLRGHGAVAARGPGGAVASGTAL